MIMINNPMNFSFTIKFGNAEEIQFTFDTIQPP